MNFQPFTWGANGQKASPSSVKRQAEIAAALAARSGAPRNVGEGLSRVGEALLHNSMVSRAEAGEAEGAASRKAIMDALMGNADPTMQDLAGAMGNEWVTSDPGSSAIVQALLGQEIQQNDPLRQMQIQQAQQGLDKGTIEIEQLRNPQPDPGFTLITPDELATMPNLDPKGAYQRGPDNRIYEIGGGGQTINVGNGEVGSIPQDYELVTDPETGARSMRVIPGSPTDIEQQRLAEKAASTDERKDTATDTITDAAAIARDLAAQGGTTGVMGVIQGVNPESDAAELRRQTSVLTSIATIENLNQMRQSSPTGGALGNVTEGEGRMLAAAAGALDPNASPEQYKRALDNYERTLLRIVHGQAEGDRIFNETRQSGGNGNVDYNAPEAPEGWGGDPALWQYMTPEDRALW